MWKVTVLVGLWILLVAGAMAEGRVKPEVEAHPVPTGWVPLAAQHVGSQLELNLATIDLMVSAARASARKGDKAGMREALLRLRDAADVMLAELSAGTEARP